MREFIPAKKYSTPLEGYVFKLSETGLGFHKESGIVKVNLENALFPALPDTAPLQLRLERLTKEQPTSKDEPVKKNQATCKAKKKKKKKNEANAAESTQDAGQRSLDPQHEQWPEDASIARADKTVKAEKQWAIDTLNPNCGKKAAEYLKWTSADIVMVQEVKVEEEDRKEYEDTARGTGWKLAVQPCLLGEKGGVSAGTAIGCKKHIGLSNHCQDDIDAWPELKGRFSAKLVGAVCKGGLVTATTATAKSESPTRATRVRCTPWLR